MPKQYESVTLADAKRMLSAAETKAGSLGIPYNIAIVDAGGHLVAFVRQDDALIGSIDLAIDKAVTARLFDKTTSELATLAQSGKPLFGIQESNGEGRHFRRRHSYRVRRKDYWCGGHQRRHSGARHQGC